jgi:hypothetical protein
MTLLVPEDVASVRELEVRLDGDLVPRDDWNRKVPIDPGAHVVVAAAPGRRPAQQLLRALEGASVDVLIPQLAEEALAGAAVPPPTASPVAPPVPAPAIPAPRRDVAKSGAGSGQRVAAATLGVVGLAGVAAGAGFGLRARSKWNDALAHCRSGDPAHCDGTGVDLAGQAATAASIATFAFVAGGVGLAAAGITWLTAPASVPGVGVTFRVVPVLRPGSAGGFAEGTF